MKSLNAACPRQRVLSVSGTLLCAVVFAHASAPSLLAQAQQHRNVIETADGKLQPAPGYGWLNDAEGDFRVRWSPGKKHSKHSHVIASQEEGQWIPAPGYTWVSETDTAGRGSE